MCYISKNVDTRQNLIHLALRSYPINTGSTEILGQRISFYKKDPGRNCVYGLIKDGKNLPDHKVVAKFQLLKGCHYTKVCRRSSVK